jgi:BirA family transcriptional regulator, biotin operon repressor / biotin---[acetyl-CoA-carboxylase] ligase
MSPEALLQRLADGESHSGVDLARDFGVTRAAVWKQIAKLEAWGLEVHAYPGQGYRLDRAVDLLDAAELSAAVDADLRGRVRRIELFTELPSTNRHLLECEVPEPERLDVCLAEHQTAGRGRRGRVWRVPFGAGLCLSTGWQFKETPPALPALTLAVGVVVRRVVAAITGVALTLKWPNDLVHGDQKLGGILVELSAEAHGGCHVVAGVGINVAVPEAVLATLSDWDRGATDLARATGGHPPPRTRLALALIAGFADLFATYAATGFDPYREEWRRADYLNGRRVRLEDASGPAFGVAAGIEADGALLVDMAAGERRRVISGDVSVRMQP